MTTIVDFVARRRAIIRAEDETRAEWEADDEFEHELNRLCREHEARKEHDRILRQKYEAAMAEKREARR